MNIHDKIKQLEISCAYSDEPDEAAHETSDSVDALIAYKCALEDLLVEEGGALDRLAAFLWADPNRFPGGADTCEALDDELHRRGRQPQDYVRADR